MRQGTGIQRATKVVKIRSLEHRVAGLRESTEG